MPSLSKIDEIYEAFKQLERHKDKIPVEQYVYELELLNSDLQFHLLNPGEHEIHEANIRKLLGG